MCFRMILISWESSSVFENFMSVFGKTCLDVFGTWLVYFETDLGYLENLWVYLEIKNFQIHSGTSKYTQRVYLDVQIRVGRLLTLNASSSPCHVVLESFYDFQRVSSLNLREFQNQKQLECNIISKINKYLFFPVSIHGVIFPSSILLPITKY